MINVIKNTIMIIVIFFSLVLIGCGGGSKTLYQAVEAGDMKVVVPQLDKNPSLLQAKDENGNMLLHHAARGGHKEMVALLLERGAGVDDREGKYSNGLTALHVAVINQRSQVARFLVEKGADVNAGVQGIRYFSTPLSTAVMYRDLEMVKYLISKGAIVKKVEKDDFANPLAQAIYNNDLEMVKILLAAGADVNESLQSGKTSLFLAVANEQMDIVKLLLAQGANVNSEDNVGRTVLHMIYYWEIERTDLLELLLAKGAVVNAVAHDGSTPLHFAAYNRFTRVTRILLAHGAGVNVQDNLGDTPSKIAIRRGGDGVKRLLLALHVAAATGDLQKVSTLLKTYPPLLHSRDEGGKTPLHVAAESNHLEIAALLIKAGAEIDTQMEFKRFTLLHGVIAKLLVPENGRIKRVHDTMTPMDIAIKKNYQQMAQLLKDNGAKK